MNNNDNLLDNLYASTTMSRHSDGLPEEPCEFREPFQSSCKLSKPCPLHQGIKFQVCGNSATRQCDFSGGICCGVPLCDSCISVNDNRPSDKKMFMGFGRHHHIAAVPGHKLGYDEKTSRITCECGMRWSLDNWGAQYDVHILVLTEQAKGKIHTT